MEVQANEARLENVVIKLCALHTQGPNGSFSLAPIRENTWYQECIRMLSKYRQWSEKPTDDARTFETQKFLSTSPKVFSPLGVTKWR